MRKMTSLADTFGIPSVELTNRSLNHVRKLSFGDVNQRKIKLQISAFKERTFEFRIKLNSGMDFKVNLWPTSNPLEQ
jgi:hypothetical protein